MKRPLGQHFLHHKNILERIIEVSRVGPEDLVVEIGPGKGRLTELLARVARKVLAIELDLVLCEELQKMFYLDEKVEILCTDVLKFDFSSLEPFRVVANIPYYITTPILFNILREDIPLITATITLQKEVAERIVASPGTKRYGVLSLMVQYLAEPEIAFRIPRGAFSPPPKVDSAVVFLKKLPKPRVQVEAPGIFRRLIKKAFQHRRKTLLNALQGGFPNIRQALEMAGIDPKIRPEALSLEDFARLSNIVSKMMASDHWCPK